MMMMTIVMVKFFPPFFQNETNLINLFLVEALSSDEDEIDELGPSYYERISNLAQEKGAESGFDIKATVKDEDEDDDSDADDLESDETVLESYTTPLDDEETPDAVDEYITFSEVMSSESSICFSPLFSFLNLCFSPQLYQHKIQVGTHC